MSGLANRRNRLWIRGTERPVLLAHHLHAGCRESSRYRWFRTTGLDRGADGGTWRSPGGSGAQGTASETSTVRQGRTCLVLSTPSPASAAGCLGGRVRERRSDKGRTGLRGTGYITRLSNLPSYATVSKSTLHEHLTVACRLCPKSEDSKVCTFFKVCTENDSSVVGLLSMGIARVMFTLSFPSMMTSSTTIWKNCFRYSGVNSSKHCPTSSAHAKTASISRDLSASLAAQAR